MVIRDRVGAWLDCSKVYVFPISDVVQKVEHCLFVFLKSSSICGNKGNAWLKASVTISSIVESHQVRDISLYTKLSTVKGKETMIEV